MEHEQGADLEGAGRARGGGQILGDGVGVIEVVAVDDVEAEKLLLGLGEGAVGVADLALAQSNGGGGSRWLERVAATSQWQTAVRSATDMLNGGDQSGQQHLPAEVPTPPPAGSNTDQVWLWCKRKDRFPSGKIAQCSLW